MFSKTYSQVTKFFYLLIISCGICFIEAKAQIDICQEEHSATTCTATNTPSEEIELPRATANQMYRYDFKTSERITDYSEFDNNGQRIGEANTPFFIDFVNSQGDHVESELKVTLIIDTEFGNESILRVTGTPSRSGIIHFAVGVQNRTRDNRDWQRYKIPVNSDQPPPLWPWIAAAIAALVALFLLWYTRLRKKKLQSV